MLECRFAWKGDTSLKTKSYHVEYVNSVARTTNTTTPYLK